MAATVREAIRELVQSSVDTLEALLELSDAELEQASDHVCAQGGDVWRLITNMIDHEKIHVGQITDGRYESRITQRPLARLAAEWLEERARFVGSVAGLSDEEFNSETAEGEWTYRAIAKHVLLVEQDALRNMRENALTMSS